jgi:hypothetical protein
MHFHGLARIHDRDYDARPRQLWSYDELAHSFLVLSFQIALTQGE